MGARAGWMGWAAAGAMLLGVAPMGLAQDKTAAAKDEKVVVAGAPVTPAPAPTADSTTDGTVTVGGQTIAYRAVAGTLTVGSTDVEDATLGLDGKPLADAGVKPPDKDKPEEAPATARMFYVAYFKKDAAAEQRPVTFLYNGGPGSSTMWLHMGAFGPRRVVTPDAEHKEGAPYRIVDNQYSLLDASDLVFIDAPGTGFSRIFGKDKEKAFWGVDQDAHAFDRFIRRFLTKYGRWNSPKYLLGESYGTPRSAVLSAVLQNVDLNGIILLSQILSFDNSIDGPKLNPGVDQAYALALPTFAATAYYHKKLPSQPAALEPFLAEVEQYALGDYMSALLQGSDLPAAREAGGRGEAARVHGAAGGVAAEGEPARNRRRVCEGPGTGRRHHDRAAGFALPGTEHGSDERGGGVRPAEQRDLGGVYGRDQQLPAHAAEVRDQQTYFAEAYTAGRLHVGLPAPAAGRTAGDRWFGGGTNVMPDLAFAMKSNPKMKVMLAGGYFDLATPFFEGMYEMHHLPIPGSCRRTSATTTSRPDTWCM